MLTLLLFLAVAAPDYRPAVMELALLEGRWLSEGKVELLIKDGSITVNANDGFDHFSGKLLVHPRTGRFAIVADGERTTEARYKFDGDVLLLTTAGVQVEYRRRGLAP